MKENARKAKSKDPTLDEMCLALVEIDPIVYGPNDRTLECPYMFLLLMIVFRRYKKVIRQI